MNFAEEIKERIQNMAIYFVEHTRHVSQLKLDKLFYFVDHAFCTDYGITISEQIYLARKRGPVPVSADKRESLFYTYQLGQVLIPDELGFYSKAPIKTFNDTIFTPKQLEYLKEISEKYCDTSGADMSKMTHEKNGLWDKIWNNGIGENDEIDMRSGIEQNSEMAERNTRLRERLALSRKAFSELGI